MLRLGLVTVVVAGCGRIGFAPIGGDGDGGDGGAGNDSGITLNGDAISAIASNLVFVTSTYMVAGSFGGLAGADAMCQQRAMAMGFPGSYVAYLSTSTVNAVDRLGSARGWSRLDGRPVFDTVADIVANAMFYPPNIDDVGNIVNISVATGTLLGGGASGQDCAGWTTTSGMVSGGTPDRSSWAFGFSVAGCGLTYPVYCFGIDRQVATVPPATVSRRAFLTQGLWKSGGGTASGDAFCQGEANAASLPGTYLALLATTTASAISRFDLAGPPWARLDNTELAVSTAAFASGATIAAFDMTTASTHVTDYVVTGATTPDQVGVNANTCNDWTITNPSRNWVAGSSEFIGFRFFSNGTFNTTCNLSGRLYCLQQ
jgi:hypothetical protein